MTWPSPLRQVLYAAFSLESVTDEHADYSRFYPSRA